MIGSLYMRNHYVKMARWCNRAALTYVAREGTRLNITWAAQYRELRDEYMERARRVAGANY